MLLWRHAGSNASRVKKNGRISAALLARTAPHQVPQLRTARMRTLGYRRRPADNNHKKKAMGELYDKMARWSALRQCPVGFSLLRDNNAPVPSGPLTDQELLPLLHGLLAQHGGTQIFLFGPEGLPFWAARTPLARRELRT